MIKDNYSFQDLLELMAKLRSETGCPWDRAQTHESIKENLIEESYEVLSAIDAGDDENLCEELGDLLLQVIFHAQMAKEAGKFDIGDVMTTLGRKLVGRHTHVFGDKKAGGAAEALDSWNAAKAREKGKVAEKIGALSGVPENMPALLRAYKIQQKSVKVGFEWEKLQDVFDKLIEEAEELKEACQSEDSYKIFDESGDLIFSSVNVVRFLKVNPELALNGSTNKFIKRFEYVEKEGKKQGKDVNQMSLQEMNELWNEAKKLEKGG